LIIAARTRATHRAFWTFLKLEKERDRRPEASFTKVSVAMDRLGFLNLLCTLLCLYSLRQLRLQQS
jgi:hypothetical protein